MSAGRVLGVEEQRAGSGFAADTSSGASLLTLDDVSDFDEDGGTCTIAGATYTYSSVNDDANTLTISPSLAASASEGDRVDLEGLERYALVSFDDDDDGPILARVPHALMRHMPAGVRDETDRESVELVESEPGDWIVTDLLGRTSARSGFAETDWTNGRGVPVIIGDPAADVDWALNQSWDFFGSFAGPAAVSLPAGGSGTVRQIGEGGAGSGAVSFTTYLPVKITASGVISVENDSATAFNVKFYLMCVDATTSTTRLGRQATQHCPSTDSGKHRQVSNQRQIFIDASEDDPHTLNFWWGLQQTDSTSHNATVRNAKMTLRVAYAPDVPTSSSPSRAPAWAQSADTAARYLTFETDDSA